MNTNTIQKGGCVYVVAEDSRISPYYASVISIGRKYIKIMDTKDCDTYDLITHESVDAKDGYNCRRKIYASKEVYEYEQRRSKLEYQIKNSLIQYIKSLTLDELLSFRKTIDQEKLIEQYTAKVLASSEEEYTHLLKLREYVATWYPDYTICKKCGTYNPPGYSCAQCRSDNSEDNNYYD